MGMKAIARFACAVMLCAASAARAGTISGFVRETPSLDPVPLVIVAFHGTGGQGNFQTVSNPLGAYDSGPLPAGNYFVVVQAPTHVDYAEFVPDIPAVGNHLHDISLEKGGVISGTVSGPGGPVEGVELELVNVTQGQVELYTTSDAAGAWATPPKLRTGGYLVRTANYEGLIDEAYPGVPCMGRGCPLETGDAVDVVAGSITQGIDFSLAAGARLKGNVTAAADSSPVAFPLLQLSDPTASTNLFFFGDATGAFDSLTGIPPGEWKLLVFPANGLLGEVFPGHACINCQIDAGEAIVVTDANDVVGLDFALEAPARMTGIVTDAQTAAPLAGAAVLVVDAVTSETVATATTLADGSYETGEIVPGDVRMIASAPGYFAQSFGNNACVPGCKPGDGAVITALAGKTEVIDVGLDKGGAITGSINGPNGPVPGVSVVVTDDDGNRSVATSDANGVYTTETALEAGTYRVRTNNLAGLVDEAWPAHLCPGAACDAETGDAVLVVAGQTTSDVDFVLDAGTRLAGSVTSAADGSPVQTTVTARHVATQFEFTMETDVLGAFDTQTGLPGGNWTLVADGKDGLLGEAWEEHPCSPCSHDAGDAVAVVAQPLVDGLDFTLDAGVAVAGVLTDADSGAPITNATITLFADETGYSAVRSVGSDAAGHYDSGLLVAGAYRIVITAPGYLGIGVCSDDPCPAGEAEWIDVDQSIADNDYALVRAAVIAGRVTGPDGSGVAGAKVVLSRSDGSEAAVAITTATGHYQVMAPAGAYGVVVHPGGHFVRTAWPDVACGPCDPADLPVVIVDSGEQRDDVDVQVTSGVRFTGSVTAEANGAPLAGVQVRVDYFDPHHVVGAVTDADGAWITEALPPGDFRLATSNAQGYIDELFEDVACPAVCDPDAATPVPGEAGETVTIDFALSLGGRVAATVRDATNGAPLAPFPTVQVHDAAGTLVTSGLADGAGHYTSAALPPGDYYIRSRNRSGLIDEWHHDAWCAWCAPTGLAPGGIPVGATAITVATGQSAAPVWLELEAGARLSGRVYRVSNQQALSQSVRVVLHDATGRIIADATTLPDGTWQTASALPPGVEVYAVLRGEGVVADQLYGGAPCPVGCDVTLGVPITLSGEADVTDIDFPIEDRSVFGDGFEDP